MTTAKEAIDDAVQIDPQLCLGKSDDDEFVFTLCARDRVAANVVRIWAMLAEQAGAPQEKVDMAIADAAAMDRWREAHGGGKVPD